MAPRAFGVPRAPRPRLPASLRLSLAERIDPRLAVIVGASMCVHLAIGVWAWLWDAEAPSMFSPRVPVEYRHPRQEVVAITLPDEPPGPGEAGPAPGVTSPVSPRQLPRSIIQPPVRPADPGMSEAEAQRYAQLLTGPEAANGTPGDLSARQPRSDLKQQLDEARQDGRTVEIGRDPRAREGTRLGTTPTGPRIDAPGQLDRQAADRERPTRLDLVPDPPRGPRQPPDHDLTIEAVLEKIRTAYMSGLQRCYQKGLVHDQALGGKVRVSFTVNERGQVVEPEASGLSPEVDACISGYMSSWRFGIPRDREREPTEATFALSLVLRAL